MPHANIQNTPLYYEDQGRGFPLVFIHGMGLSHANWCGQIKHFSRNYRVITYDVRGHGRSGVSLATKPQEYLSVLSQDLKQLLDYLKIEKAHFIAYSTGTLILLQFLRNYSFMCERAVLTGAFPRINNAYLYTKIGAAYLLTLLNACEYEAYGVAKSNGVDSRQIKQFKEEALKVRRSEMLLFLRSLFLCDLTSFLPQLNIPMLLIYGGNDRHMMKYRHMMLTSLPQAEVCLVPKISHACPTKGCETFNMLVEDFLTAGGTSCNQTIH
jgi:pimeloyl-ACP methyl ester carboxylesterase